MTHLSPDQFVDAVEGSIGRDPAAAAHLAVCDACRAEVANLAEAMGVARSVAMPEPSPLFWDHFSRRVGAAVASEALPPAASWRHVLADAWRPLGLVGIAAAALTVAVVLRPVSLDMPAPVATSVQSVADVTPAADNEVNEDARLSVLAAVVQDLKTEEVQQVVRPSADAAGAAIQDLTPAQCEQLMRLIKAQMAGVE